MRSGRSWMTWVAVIAAMSACNGSAKGGDRAGAATSASASADATPRAAHTDSAYAGSGSAMGSGAGSGSASYAYAPPSAVARATESSVRSSAGQVARAAAATGDLAPSARTPGAADGHKLIRHGDMRVIVDGVDGARVKLETLADEAGGFIDRSQIDHEDGHASRATIVLRIPADRFMEVMRGTRELGQVDRDESETEDVTAEYTDLAARLGNTKRLEQRLLQLVDTRAGSMSEVLEVENQIGEVRGEIEQMEGRLRLWNDQIALSRITVELVLKRAPVAVVAKIEPVPSPPTWWDRVTGAAHASLAALGDAGTAIAMAGAAALPWLPLVVVALLVLRAIGRRITRARRLRRMRTRATDAAESDVAARAAVAAAQAAGIAAAIEVAAAASAEPAFTR